MNVIFILLCIVVVVYLRATTAHLRNGGYAIIKYHFILHSSLEQLIQPFAIKLVLVPFLSAELTLKYIPALSFVYLLGRLPVWLNIYQYKTLGFIVSVGPALTTLILKMNIALVSPYTGPYSYIDPNNSAKSFSIKTWNLHSGA